ncbi:MAG: bifunctional diaminohydroxyphosphoribosylaminopyrimidine deaminase/5-amino-6-(5-phosphoribosylamino)uracil reductase RibD [Bdellovibrio sp.]|nr:MAG: bifunctional diaminohydroxyphosphoribosylaminopyrimidine deaminase/5-amino-6-(5-phosphoribosylamino)uracil reductase RibD [Bdellovibrio sp.]
MDQVLKLFLGEAIETPRPGQVLTDIEAMKLALAEAWKGVGRVSPNPPVGCVILSSKNEFLAQGHHSRPGGPHAEIAALAHLAGVPELERQRDGWDLSPLDSRGGGEKLQGARMFVTLEPCAHAGKTPSCARTLASLPIAEVVFGMIDPFPAVSGRGRDILERAGKRCTLFAEHSSDAQMLVQELNELCEQFLVNVRFSRPFITLKVACSLDGVFTLRTGESQWITGEQSRAFAQFFRGSHDAILVGRATVGKDNPSLTIRHPQFANVQKKIVVVDTHGVLLEREDLKLFKLHRAENLIWAVGEKWDGRPRVPVEIVRVPADARGLSLRVLHDCLWQRGIRSLFIEAGGKTLSAHLAAEVADRLLMFQSPLILGSRSGRVWSEGFGVQRLSEALRLKGLRRMSLGNDLVVTGRIAYAEDVEID